MNEFIKKYVKKIVSESENNSNFLGWEDIDNKYSLDALFSETLNVIRQDNFLIYSIIDVTNDPLEFEHGNLIHPIKKLLIDFISTDEHKKYMGKIIISTH